MLRLTLAKKGGDKERLMTAVGSLGGGTGLREFHAHRRLLWRVARTQTELAVPRTVVLVFRNVCATCDPLPVKTATRAATDLNAATDLELQLPQKWGDKEGVMMDVALLDDGAGLREFHSSTRTSTAPLEGCTHIDEVLSAAPPDVWRGGEGSTLVYGLHIRNTRAESRTGLCTNVES